uniref:Uncharacterized protein n=1 Tax=Cacopsylla melanoneura TaxID=428564 RepID=A0A8D8QRS5_9HEMI
MLNTHSPVSGINTIVCSLSGIISSWARYHATDGVGRPVTVARSVAGAWASAMTGLRGLINLGASPDSSFSKTIRFAEQVATPPIFVALQENTPISSLVGLMISKVDTFSNVVMT